VDIRFVRVCDLAAIIYEEIFITYITVILPVPNILAADVLGTVFIPNI